MALKAAVRFRPDTYRSSMETTVAGLTEGPPQSGTIVRIVQLIAYDDTELSAQNYAPGSPDTESKVIVVAHTDRQLDIAAFEGKSIAQCEAVWQAELDAYETEITPYALTLGKSLIGSRQVSPTVLDLS